MFDSLSIDHFVISICLGVICLAALYDAVEFLIPNIIPIVLAALYPLHVVAAPVPVPWPWALAVAAAVLATGAGLFSVGAMGGGDVKLLTAVALWAGPANLLAFLFVTTLAGGLMALALMSRWRYGLALLADHVGVPRLREVLLGRVIPYGLAIAVGGILVLSNYLRT